MTKEEERAAMWAQLQKDKAEQDPLISDEFKEIVAEGIKQNWGALVMLSKT